jgi:hypothetical protein
MPRYFFHVHLGETIERDTIGLELPALDDAIANAEQARLEIMLEDALDELWLEIVDQSGSLVAMVPAAWSPFRPIRPSADQDLLRFSDRIDDADKLLAATARMGLEGIVNKKCSAPYLAGPNCGWVKVKTQPWRQANRDRCKMFEKE